MRKRDEELSKGWGQFVTPLSVDTIGGKQKLNCANAKGLLRIIQSIPSPKAEPFKLWLAQVGSDRLDEIEGLEVAINSFSSMIGTKRSSNFAVAQPVVLPVFVRVVCSFKRLNCKYKSCFYKQMLNCPK